MTVPFETESIKTIEDIENYQNYVGSLVDKAEEIGINEKGVAKLEGIYRSLSSLLERKEEDPYLQVSFRIQEVVYGIAERGWYMYAIKPAKEDCGYVYLASADWKEYKIGKSKNPENRVKGMRTARPGILLQSKWWCDGHLSEIENKIHERLSEYKVSGEWFNIGEPAVAIPMFRSAAYSAYLELE